MNRYQQQIILSEFGKDGQNLISNSKVLIIGAGGLGTIVCGYLTAMGVGAITICDFDTVEESNLHRQLFYSPKDLGLKKAAVLTNRMTEQNPEILVNSIEEVFSEKNADSLISGHQIICDCSDNAETRLLLDKYCDLHNKPLIHGAVSDWQGYITVLHYKLQFSLSDLFDLDTFLQSNSCSLSGINSPLCGIIGSYMANEVVKIILNTEGVLEGKLLYINGLKNNSKYFNLKKVNFEHS